MRVLLLSIVLIFFVLNANAQSAIDAEIEKIMSASSSERYKLMNQLKRKLATMNHDERNEALQKLSGGKNINNQATGITNQQAMFMNSVNINKSSHRPVGSGSAKGKH